MIALCLGSAPSVWGEVQDALEMLRGRPCRIIVANHTGIHLELPIDAWVTFHHDRMPAWEQERIDWMRGWPVKEMRLKFSPENIWMPNTWRGCSSGMFTAWVAMQRFHAKPILCGVHLDPDPKAHLAHDGLHDYSLYQDNATRLPEAHTAAIRSMGGWTRQRFGYPTEAWLEAAYEDE